MSYDNLPRFSASKLTTYQSCSTWYAAKYIHHIPMEVESTWAILGTACHEAIEGLYTRGEFPYDTFDAVAQEKFKALDGMSYIGYTPQQVRDKGYAILDKFDYDLFSPVAIEKEFLLPFPNADNPICLLHGFIDMITDDDRVIDLKTNSKAPTQKAVNASPQLAIYSWAFNQMYDRYPSQVAIHHLPTMRLIAADVYDMRVTMLEVEDMIAGIISAEYPAKEDLTKCSKCSPFCPFYHKE